LPTPRVKQEVRAREDAGPQQAVRQRRTHHWLLGTGVVLLLLSIVGFATVADDLRHVGELLAVASLCIAGAALVTASFPNPLSRTLALPWLAMAVIAGALCGAATDHMAIGFASGALAGLLISATTSDRRFH
jgi:hypothetical protein